MVCTLEGNRKSLCQGQLNQEEIETTIQASTAILCASDEVSDPKQEVLHLGWA